MKKAITTLVLVIVFGCGVAHAQCSNVVTDADVNRVKADMIQSGFANPPDSVVREQARYEKTQAYVVCSVNQWRQREDAKVLQAQRALAGMDAMQRVFDEPAPSYHVAPLPDPTMPPAPSFSASAVPVPDGCAMSSCPRESPTAPSFVPYDAVSGSMPGITPEGTAR